MQTPLTGKADQLPRYIVVEGAIGVGKTTLVKRLGQLLSARTILEIFEENPFLSDFYSDRDRYAFQTEMFFLLSRYRQQESFSQEDLLQRFSISDYLFVKSHLFSTMTLSNDELGLFENMYSILHAQVPEPDLVIYLTANVNTLLDRIRKRGRPYEEGMDPNYIAQVANLYDDFFAKYRETPLLIVNSEDIDFSDRDTSLDGLLEEMRGAMKDGRRVFSPGPPSIQAELLL